MKRCGDQQDQEDVVCHKTEIPEVRYAHYSPFHTKLNNK